MSPKRIAAVTRRIVEQFRHDRRTLALLFIAPIAIIGLLGWVLGGQSSPSSRVAVVNESSAPAAALATTQLEKALEGQTSIRLVADVADEAAARQMIKDNKLDLAIVIPASFSATNRSIQLVSLGLNPTAEFGSLPSIQKALISSIGSQIPGGPPSIERATIYGSANATQLDTLAPVFVGFFAYFFVFILTGISFLRERIGGTLERLLATPVSRAEIVIGYSLGFGIFATLQVALVLAFVLGRIEIPALGPIPAFAIGMGVHIAGSPVIGYLIVLALGMGAVSLGIFISTFARTEFQILQFIPLVIVPQALLGGFFWPIDQLPDLLQPVARVLPVTYAIDGLRQVMIAGADFSSAIVVGDLLVLVAIAALFIGLAAATIRREVA